MTPNHSETRANVTKQQALVTTQAKNKYTVEVARKAQLMVEAKIRVTLAGQVRNNPRYETLFTGLKKNHPH